MFPVGTKPRVRLELNVPTGNQTQCLVQVPTLCYVTVSNTRFQLNYRFPITDSRFPVTDSRFPVTDSEIKVLFQPEIGVNIVPYVTPLTPISG
jgi:hypothetical protein